MSRNFARKGDKTTANGDVLEGEPSFKHHGIPVAFHGAKVYCPACNSTGVLMTVPPHHPFKVNGKQVALEGDLCVCKCSPPPRLLASQSSARMSFDGSSALASTQSRVRTSGGDADAVRYSDHFQLVDEETGKPLAGVEYAIRRETGEIEYGVSAENGLTHLLSSTTATETVEIYI